MAKDTFLNATDTEGLGLIAKSNIIKFKDMPQFNSEASIKDKMASIAAFYNKNSKTKTMTDFKGVAAKLNLQAEASESSIVGAIDKLIEAKATAEKELKKAQATLTENESTIETHKGEIETLKSSVAKFEKKETELKETMAKSEVSKAIEDGKFKEEDREELEVMAVKNPEMFTKIVGKAQVEKKVEGANIAAQLTGDSLTEMASKYGVTVAEMNYGDLWKNNPTVLARMEKEEPKFHAKLKENWEE
jgi:hypothetical protein